MPRVEFELGDRVSIDGDVGVVVGLIERDEYVDASKRARWRALGAGVIVQVAPGDLRHVRDPATVLRPLPATPERTNARAQATRRR